jgi:hypothetical protein
MEFDGNKQGDCEFFEVSGMVIMGWKWNSRQCRCRILNQIGISNDRGLSFSCNFCKERTYLGCT